MVGGIALGAALAALIGAALILWRERLEIARLRRRLDRAADDLHHLQTSFTHFAPREIVDRIAASGVDTRGEKKEVTVLFADLVGFTALSEQLDPVALVRILNDYFARMSAAIREHRGHVAKFIGDGLMALFGALEPNPWQVNDAAHAALAMRAALAQYNRELANAGLPELRVGIGVHCGIAVAGVIGNRDLMEFTVIGNVVNLAARVEHLTREHGADILVTGTVRDRLDPRFRLMRLPDLPVHGVAEPVVTYSVDGFEVA